MSDLDNAHAALLRTLEDHIANGPEWWRLLPEHHWMRQRMEWRDSYNAAMDALLALLERKLGRFVAWVNRLLAERCGG